MRRQARELEKAVPLSPEARLFCGQPPIFPTPIFRDTPRHFVGYSRKYSTFYRIVLACIPSYNMYIQKAYIFRRPWKPAPHPPEGNLPDGNPQHIRPGSV